MHVTAYEIDATKRLLELGLVPWPKSVAAKAATAATVPTLLYRIQNLHEVFCFF